MKKTIALVLALVLALSLCACGSTATESTGSAASGTGSAATTNSGSSATTTTDASASGSDAAGTTEPAEVAWPTKDVTIYVPASVGAPLDLATRVMADYLTEYTGYTFVVENDDVGAGYGASETVSTATPDGSVIMASGSGQIVTYYNGTWDRNPANPDDFTLLGVSIQQVQPSGAVIVTNNDAPYSTWQEFVDYVNANPQTVTVGYAAGTPHEIRLKLLLDYFGIMDKVRFVTGSNTDINTGLLGGNINIGCLTETVGPQYVTEGSLKGLLYSNYERTYKRTEASKCLDNMQMVSDVVSENPEALCCAWDIAYVGPAGMDPALAQKICDTLATICDNAEYMQRITDLGSTNNYIPVSLEELQEHLKLAETQISGFYSRED